MKHINIAVSYKMGMCMCDMYMCMDSCGNFSVELSALL